jgi:NET1-associated nuclear protein 1 (U3 small nucleolar RNA-associated protein 17)
VYSTSNSLLNRSIKLSFNQNQNLDANIVAYVLSPTEPDIIWIACSDGFVYKVDWTSGEGSNRSWRVSHGGITNMAVAAINSAGRRRDVLFTTGKHDEGWRISAHELVVGKSATIESRTVYTSAQVIQILTANDEGTVIIAASEERVLLGAIRNIDFDLIDKIRYEFRIFESTDLISSMDVRVSKRNRPPGSKASKMDRVEVVDVVAGDVKGAIFVHNDLLGNLTRSQNPSVDGQHPISLIPRKLHWHRKSVQAAKWSLDGLCRFSTRP